MICTNVQESRMATRKTAMISADRKIAQLYYEQDMTQAQIARELGIYRTTISRLLKRGREQGIVTIAINYDYNENLWLEQQLKQKFGRRSVVVSRQ
ncbi:sigma factor-like helix-turn-helix DNA-binding protein [Shigella flexneri]